MSINLEENNQNNQHDLFKESQTRSPSEEALFIEWRKAMVGWEKSSHENNHLRHLIEDLQSQINALKSELDSRSKIAIPQPSNTSAEYKTDDEELAQETEWIRVKHKTKKRKMNTSLTPPRKEKTPPPKEKRDPAPPPIIVEKVNSYEKMYSVITKEINASKFQVKLISENSAKINAVDPESFRAVITVLEKENYTFHTYENKQSRPIRVMIKELHHTCNPESIINNLREQGFEATGAVNKLSFKNKSPLNMFMVTFENNQDIDKIYKITNVLGCRVNIEAIKGSKMIPQCKKCQAFGHTRTYCSRQYRCVKCAGKHSTTECNKAEDMEAKCVNCGGSHPASYRGCIVAKELQMIKNKKLKTKQMPSSNISAPATKITTQHTTTRPSDQVRTYANVVATTSNTKPGTESEVSLTHSLQLILERITRMDNSIASINVKVNHLEGRLSPINPHSHQQ